MQEQAQKLEEQSKEMKEQTGQLVGEVATLRNELIAKLQQDFQEAIKQLSEVINDIIIIIPLKWEELLMTQKMYPQHK